MKSILFTLEALNDKYLPKDCFTRYCSKRYELCKNGKYLASDVNIFPVRRRRFNTFWTKIYSSKLSSWIIFNSCKIALSFRCD